MNSKPQTGVGYKETEKEVNSLYTSMHVCQFNKGGVGLAD